jgi:transposase
MLDMPQIDDIRRLYSEGCNISEIARITGYDRKTVKKYLDMDDFSPQVPKSKSRPSKLDPYKEKIDRILDEDSRAWRKQRHTATKILEEIRACGYGGGYSTVQTYVSERKRQLKAGREGAFLDLVWSAGIAQCDFGEADFDFRGKRTRLNFLVLSFPFSNMGYFQVFSGTTAECVCQGLMDIFAHIGGVPSAIVFDNATGIGRKTSGGVHETSLFRRFRLHFGFEARFCNPYAGHEKGNVERKVAFVRRNAFVPIPVLDDIVSYNATLFDLADSFANRKHHRRNATWGQLFESDESALSDMPPRPFSAIRWEAARTDKYGELTLEGSHVYDVSPMLPSTEVMVGYGAHTMTFAIAATGEVVRECDRHFGNAKTHSKDLTSQLGLLRKKPGAWLESEIRAQLPSEIVAHLDALPRSDLASQLALLDDATRFSGFDIAVESMRRLVEGGRDFTRSDMKVLGMRISSGKDTPDLGPDLRLYDMAFLDGKRGA